VVNVTIDGYGTETYWTLSDNNNGTVYGTRSPGSYPHNMPGLTFTDTLCVPPNTCMNFTINDSYGNGICCDDGNGSYEVFYDGMLVASGGEFTSFESTSFNCPPGQVCEAAVPVTEGSHTTATANQFYEFVPPQVGMYNVSTCSLNSCDTKIWIYDNCNNTTYESNTGSIAYNDNNPECGADANLNVPLDANTPYYIRIGDTAGDCEDESICL